MQEEGIIYVLTNDSMPGYVKIGMTTTSVEQRMAELDKTGVPLPFTCRYAVCVSNVKQAEKLIHDIFGDYRARRNREFFTVSLDRVVAALKLAGGKQITEIEGKVVENAANDDKLEAKPEEASDNIAKKRRNISLYALGIKDDEELTFVRDKSIKCKVVGDRQVEYEGKHWYLSGLAWKLLGYGETTGVNGSWCFEYKGEILWNMRERLENEDV